MRRISRKLLHPNCKSQHADGGGRTIILVLCVHHRTHKITHPQDDYAIFTISMLGFTPPPLPSRPCAAGEHMTNLKMVASALSRKGHPPPIITLSSFDFHN